MYSGTEGNIGEVNLSGIRLRVSGHSEADEEKMDRMGSA
jgi:hypothetical protein